MDAQQNRLGYVWCWWFLLFFEPPFDIRRAFLKKKTEKRRNRSPQLRPERIRRGNIWQPSYILCLEFVVFGTEGPCCWNLSCWQVFSLYIWKEWKEHGTLARVFLSHSVRGEKVSGESRGLMANNSAPMGHMHIVCLLAVVVLLYVQKGRKKKTLIGISTTWWGYISADIFLLVYSFWYGSLSPCFLISHLAVYG